MAQKPAPQKPSAQSTKKAPPRVGAIFAGRLREARRARSWTQQDLADALDKLGVPMDRTTVAKLEKGQREVRLDELVALAAALDVAIVHLIFPIDGDRVLQPVNENREPLPRRAERRGPLVRLAPALSIDQAKARRWAQGRIPLDPANFRTYRDQAAGDLAVSDEELSPADKRAVWEAYEQLMCKMGIVVKHDPVEQLPHTGPTRRGRRAAGKE